MDYRGVLLVGLVGGAAIFGATTSCSAPDPGQITFSERPRGSGGELTSGGTTSGGTDGGSSGTTSGGTDGGGGDGGSSGVAADPVFGTTAFAAGSTGQGAPAKAANPAHGGDSSGKDCMVTGCHINQWGFGGTLYADAAGGAARVAGAEIRISRPDGTLFQATFSDVDGNFWIQGLGMPIPANSRVGVRTAAGLKMNMAGAIGAGQAGCNQAGTCHGATAGKVFIK